MNKRPWFVNIRRVVSIDYGLWTMDYGQRGQIKPEDYGLNV